MGNVPMGNQYATPDNELPYTPDLHIAGTVKKQDTLTFWLWNPLYEAGYSKIQWHKEENNECTDRK